MGIISTFSPTDTGRAFFPDLNAFLAKRLVWPIVDNDIRHELNPQIKPNEYATEMVRDSVAHAGIPDHNNVFEYGYPDARDPRNAASTAPNSTSQAARGSQAPASVFETGAPPFVPVPSNFQPARAPNALKTGFAGGGGVLGTNSPSAVPSDVGRTAVLGGLPGLLASVAGIDPDNPFLPTPPQDVAPVRQLISRPAHY